MTPDVAVIREGREVHHQYDSFEHAVHEGVPIYPEDGLPGAGGYDAPEDAIVLSRSLTLAEIHTNLAIYMAARDIHRAPSRYPHRDPRYLAATRFFTPERLGWLLEAHGGGVTAIAIDVGLTPTIVGDAIRVYADHPVLMRVREDLRATTTPEQRSSLRPLRLAS